MEVANKIRLFRADRNLSQQEMAEKLGISRRSYGLYELGKTTPNADKIQLMAEIFHTTADDILCRPQTMKNTSEFLPIKGLAECGLMDWYKNSDMLAIQIAKPADITDTNAFAVIATGTSLIPEGVKPGFICICSPALAPQKGDIVFLEESSGHASMKRFDKADDNFIYLTGYLPPDETGEQQPYTDQRPMHNLKTVAPVVYVKRRV